MNDVTRYPLSWPHGWPRKTEKKDGRFSSGRGQYGGKRSLTVSDAFDRLEAEAIRLGAVDGFLSSNLVLGMRGNPLSNQAEPADSGVAFYFKLDGRPHVLACDTYHRCADNIAALAAHIEALRAIERYGVGSRDQAFAGYSALPPPSADNRPPWRGMLGFPPTAKVTAEDVKVAYRAHAKNAANDEGALLQLNLARDAALAEIGA